MRLKKILAGTSVAIFLTIGLACESQYFSTFAQSLPIAKTAGVAVGPQYDTTHVYVAPQDLDRKSTRLNSSHEWISYAVFCLKKKKKKKNNSNRDTTTTA